jgi:hypothetical protein
MKKWFNKQTITVFFLTAILFSTVTLHAETRTISAFFNNIKIMVNGQIIETDVEPCIVDGRTMVPIRFIAEAFGATVKYNEATDTVEVESITEAEPTPMQQDITPVQDTASEQIPEVTLSPTPEPTPEVTQATPEPTPDNQAQIDALTAAYNADIQRLEIAANSAYSAENVSWIAESKGMDKSSVTYSIHERLHNERLHAIYLQLVSDKAAREAELDADIAAL